MHLELELTFCTYVIHMCVCLLFSSEEELVGCDQACHLPPMVCSWPLIQGHRPDSSAFGPYLSPSFQCCKYFRTDLVWRNLVFNLGVQPTSSLGFQRQLQVLALCGDWVSSQEESQIVSVSEALGGVRFLSFRGRIYLVVMLKLLSHRPLCPRG